MSISKKFALLFFSLASFSTVFSQKPDFGIWYGASGELKISRKFSFDLSGSIRTINNASRVKKDFIEGLLSYKIIKHISVAGGFRPEYRLDKDDVYRWRHLWLAEVKGSLPIGRLTLSTRFRYENRYKTYFLDRNDEIPVAHGRYRFKAFYSIRKFPLSPFIDVEYFRPMYRKAIQNPARFIDKERYTYGLEYYFARRQSMEFEYIHQVDYSPHLVAMNILSLAYAFKF